MEKRQLLIATKNTGKVKELERLLADLPVALKSLNDFQNIAEPEETGSTFGQNAALKAKSYSLQTRLWALADDSGLEVDALNGAPGIFSARYGGPGASDRQRTEKLLIELDKAPGTDRSARFVCAMALSDENGGIIFLTEGVCRGSIARAPAGTRGFGYDPVFVPEGFTETFGELSDQVKQKISHRAQAAEKIIGFLRSFIEA